MCSLPPPNQPRLLLVDALNILYRAFYAISGLSTSSGQPTNAVFGFIKTLMHLERLWQPTHWLVVFDGAAPLARLELFPEYKAQRPPMPTALRSQFKPLEDYLDRARIPRLRLEDQEADDVLASAATRAATENYEVLVVSSDKDLMQIVDERVALVAPSKAQEKVDAPSVFGKTGVWPAQIVDWLALIGDSADNIAGVPGVGAKTAAKWLAQWDSLANIWQHLEELQPAKLRQMLSAHRELVQRNVQLVRLRRDIACWSSFAELCRQPPDEQSLRALFEELEFHSLARQLSTPTLF